MPSTWFMDVFLCILAGWGEREPPLWFFFFFFLFFNIKKTNPIYLCMYLGVYLFIVFLGLHLCHMEVPRLGVKLEL